MNANQPTQLGELQMEIPTRQMLSRARNIPTATAHDVDSTWVSEECANWINDHGGVISSMHMSDFYFVTFQDTDTLMMFKLTFPP